MSDISERMREFEQDNDGVPSPYELLNEAADTIDAERALVDDLAAKLGYVADVFSRELRQMGIDVEPELARWREARGL